MNNYNSSFEFQESGILVRTNRYYLFIKRGVDILGSIIGLILAFPIMIIVMILIKLEDPKGPIFLNRYEAE